ncbi:hypothetical protein [Rosenbergiella australiborealis]|uniref:hypothetical protein n=1 Tax=Rosenbergiella australiborealis TaxID=1544696 RepID=UPI001F4ED69B|nr:hypothetical protein [Rosenbergiella australiborealis]
MMLFTDPLQFLENLKGEIKGLLDSLLWEGAGNTIFDFLTSAGKEITELWNGLEKLIDKVVGIALKGFGEIGKAWQKVKRWFGMGEDEVANRQVSQRTDVRIDNIEIQTQATDAKGIAQEIPGNLKDATWHFDDGLRA